MTPMIDVAVRDVLVDRRQRLVQADRVQHQPEIHTLVADIDAALARFERGTFGICDVCREHLDADHLEDDPLALSCREHPSAREAARLDRDLTLARRVQHALLPSAAGSITGWDYQYLYRPAGDVGGDFIDVLPNRKTGETLVVMGDVSGKGVAASMLMSSLLATIRSLSSVGMGATELLTRVNTLFHDSTSPSAYATLAAALLRPGGETDLYSAGHWPPILRRAARSLEPLALDAGLPIGLFPSAGYAPTRVRLQPDDTLLFYTDGAIDEDNSAGEEVSRRRLGESLTSAGGQALPALLETCLSDVTASRNGRPATDDLMLLAVRKTTSGVVFL
jgi:sigma-B regulation protein RsbU (phosphoserine phosphatase)